MSKTEFSGYQSPDLEPDEDESIPPDKPAVRAVVHIDDSGEVQVFTEGMRVEYVIIHEYVALQREPVVMPMGQTVQAWVSSNALSQHAPDFVQHWLDEEQEAS